MGRFIQEDPIGTSDDINLYRYVANNPMKYVDRMGLAAKAFMVAYDEYSAIKSRIYNINGRFDMGFVLADTDTKEKLLEEYNKKRDYARGLHYARNRLNTDLPTSIEDAKEKEWNQPTLFGSTSKAASYHQDTSVPGTELKFVSSDGHKEVIFTENGDIIENKRYGGTYNFFGPSNWIGHYNYDMSPFYEWGN